MIWPMAILIFFYFPDLTIRYFTPVLHLPLVDKYDIIYKIRISKFSKKDQNFCKDSCPICQPELA